MKKIFLLIFSVLVLLFSQFKICLAQETGYDQIYNSLPNLDFHYDNSEDPDEIADYHEFIISPYTLMRISDTLSTKNTIFKPGYYLLSPKNQDGYDFVMFKQKGKIVGLVPVFEKQTVDPLITYPQPPKPKVGFWSGLGMSINTGIAKLFHKYEKPPDLPKSKIESNYVGAGNYLEIDLYRDKYLYKILLKVQR